MHLKLVEPLRELFKDEVRELGRELGVPSRVLERQPFPGPGLAVRIIGPVTEERLRILREADAIVDAEIRAAGLYESIWQSFAVLLPIKTVGVMGDFRTYENVAAVRAVQSQDGMTADWVRLPYDVLQRISTRIINEVKGSTASRTTSPRSLRAPSSGNEELRSPPPPFGIQPPRRDDPVQAADRAREEAFDARRRRHRSRRDDGDDRVLRRGAEGRCEADSRDGDLRRPGIPRGEESRPHRRIRLPPDPAGGKRCRVPEPPASLLPRHTEGFYYRPRVDKELLRKYSKG